MNKMNSGKVDYERVIATLRSSKPELRSPEETTEKVMNRILMDQASGKASSGILDFLFGWVYVGWVRTSLVAASVILVLGFVYQQAVILKRVNNLNRQAVYIEDQIITGNNTIPDAALFYQLAGRKLNSGNINISERQIRQIMRSYKELEEKYSDLMNLIETNPALKKYVDEQLSESNKEKFKL